VLRQHLNHPFSALARCVGIAGATLRDRSRSDCSGDGYRELWSARRLVDATQLVLTSARWETAGEEYVPVSMHHLVLLEAAYRSVTGDQADTADGFPHLGATFIGVGVCDAGRCPCRDGSRVPQPSLLDRAA